MFKLNHKLANYFKMNSQEHREIFHLQFMGNKTTKIVESKSLLNSFKISKKSFKKFKMRTFLLHFHQIGQSKEYPLIQLRHYILLIGSEVLIGSFHLFPLFCIAGT